MPAPDGADHLVGIGVDPASSASAGMGCVETLAHGHDIASGLGFDLDPPREVCSRVLARMFPHVAPGPAEDPRALLLWATGRRSLSGRAPVGQWRWRGAPLGEDS